MQNNYQKRLSRREFYAQTPGANEGFMSVHAAVASSGVEPALVELVNLRVSQINGCAFCVAFHASEARKHGVSQRKLDMLPVWREASDYDPRERAALRWAEIVTGLSEQDITDELYSASVQTLGEETLARLTIAVALVNAWNRIATPFAFTPPA